MDCSICRKRKVSFNSKHWLETDNGVAVCNPCYGEFHSMMDLMNKINNKSGTTSSYSANWGKDIATRWIKEMMVVVEQANVEVEQVKAEAKVEAERVKEELEQVKEEAGRVKAEAERAMEEGIKQVKVAAQRATEEEIKQVKVAAQRATEEEIKQVKEEMKQREEEWIRYLLTDVFTEESHSDIQVKPSNGASIPAHKFLLATKSEVFKYMLSSDTCKAAEIDSVCLPEFNHDELKTFLELLYCGNLAKEKFEMHYYSLALASHKYAIPYLEKFCEERILNLIDLSNAFKVLEISEICSNETLKVAALELIRNHKEEILWSPAFEEFSIKNPHLMLHIMRYCCPQA